MSSSRIMFLRDRNNFPVGCLAIRLRRNLGTAEYQLSVLNPLDKFNRSVARHLALGRLMEKPISVIIGKDYKMNEISYAVMFNLAASRTAPTRAVKAARHWINDVNKKFNSEA